MPKETFTLSFIRAGLPQLACAILIYAGLGLLLCAILSHVRLV